MAKKFKIKIFRATQSFLYLPAYIAKDLKIFEAILGKTITINGESEPYEFEVSFVDLNKEKGDVVAINDMIKANHDSKTVAIAIGNPVAFIKPDMDEEKTKNIRIIGAIINKLTFWAVDHKDVNYTETSEFNSTLNEHFSKVIYPKSEYATGFYLGKRVCKEANIREEEDVEFDTEISKLMPMSTETEHIQAVAITADIATIAEKTTEKQLYINYPFSKEGDFLTTGIITTKSKCEKYPDIITKIIEAFQKSISILYSSEETAKRVCAKIAEDPNFNFKSKFSGPIDKNSASITGIIRMMNDEKFYPADLNISEKGWDAAIKALSETQLGWDNEDNRKFRREILSNSFDKYVDHSFVRKSERSIAKQFGINLKTFKKTDIAKHIITGPFKGIASLFKRNVKVWRYSIIILIIILVIWGLEKFLQKDLSNKHISLTILLAIVYLILEIFIHRIARKKDD